MFHDGFTIMMNKYFADAKGELAANRRRHLEQRLRREAELRRYRIAKKAFLAMALAGAAVGLHYAHDLGGLLATNMTNSHAPDPSLQAPPPSKAKHQRKISEERRQREKDLEEIEKF